MNCCMRNFVISFRKWLKVLVGRDDMQNRARALISPPMSYLDNDGVQSMGVIESGDPGLTYSAHARSLVDHAPKVGAAKRRKVLNYPGPGLLHMTQGRVAPAAAQLQGAWLEGLGLSGHAGHRVRVAVVHSASLSPVSSVFSMRSLSIRPGLRCEHHPFRLFRPSPHRFCDCRCAQVRARRPLPERHGASICLARDPGRPSTEAVPRRYRQPSPNAPTALSACASCPHIECERPRH